MISNIFESILEELGKAINIEGLHPDEHQTCLIQFKNGLKIQFELDKSAEFLIMGSQLGTIPPGRYRESIFREALKENRTSWPRYGRFAFSPKADKLVLFEMISLRDINSTKVTDVLTPFSEKALNWQTAIARSEMPVPTPATASHSSKGMFGLVR